VTVLIKEKDGSYLDKDGSVLAVPGRQSAEFGPFKPVSCVNDFAENP